MISRLKCSRPARKPAKSPLMSLTPNSPTFTGIMAFMIVLLAVAMRRYYALMPPNLKQVVRDLNGGLT